MLDRQSLCVVVFEALSQYKEVVKEVKINKEQTGVQFKIADDEELQCIAVLRRVPFSKDEERIFV